MNTTDNDTLDGELITLTALELKRLNYPRWGFVTTGGILLVCALLGTIENSWALYIFVKNKKLRLATNYFIIGLCVCDLCLSVITMPLPVAASFAGYWNSGDIGCTFEAFMVYLLGLTSLYIMTFISIDRLIVIVYPLQAHFVTKRAAVIAVLACAGGGLCWALLPLFGWNGYGQELPGVSCGLQYHDHSAASTSYIITIFVFVFLLPICVMLFCYSAIYRTIWMINKSSNAVTSVRIATRNTETEKKLLKTCIAIIVSFGICWTPYAVVSFWQSFGNIDSLPLTLTLIPAMTAKCQVAVNPVVYVVTNANFRKAFYRSIPCGPIRVYMLSKESRRSSRGHYDLSEMAIRQTSVRPNNNETSLSKY